MLQINRDYHERSGNYTPGGNSCRYIALHYTCSVADARREALNQANNSHESSFHYVLDGAECYQVLDDTDTAWAVGAWAGCVQYIRNNETISIEVCNNGGPYTSSQIDQLCELVPMLMERHGIDADHVVRHYDCHSGHKLCPIYYAQNDFAWEELKETITEGSNMPSTKEVAVGVWTEPLDGGYNDGVQAKYRLIGIDKAANDIHASLFTDKTGRTDGSMPIQERLSYLGMAIEKLDERQNRIESMLQQLIDKQ